MHPGVTGDSEEVFEVGFDLHSAWIFRMDAGLKPARIGDHGGFAHDDTNVMLLVANPRFRAQTVFAETTTTQVAPTILDALGLDPKKLDAVRIEARRCCPRLRRSSKSSR